MYNKGASEPRKLKKAGKYRCSVIISKEEIIDRYGWHEKQKVVVTDKGHRKVEIRDWRG